MGQPLRSEAETLANQCFEALMWAMSRPGHIRALPEAGAGSLVAALIDRECAVFAEDADIAERVRRSGGHLSDVERADHVFLNGLRDAEIIQRLRMGSDLYPEEGATLIAPARFDSGAALRLTGPGVEGHMDVTLGDVPASVWQARRHASRYPMGFEMILIDGARVMGIPRSTQVEVL